MGSEITAVANWNTLVKTFGSGGVPVPFATEIYLLDCLVAGTGYVEDISRKTAGFAPGTVVTLRREPENRYDEFAILVLNEQGEKLGYIPRRENLIPARLMDGGMYLYGKVEEIRDSGDWLSLSIGLYMRAG